MERGHLCHRDTNVDRCVPTSHEAQQERGHHLARPRSSGLERLAPRHAARERGAVHEMRPAAGEPRLRGCKHWGLQWGHRHPLGGRTGAIGGPADLHRPPALARLPQQPRGDAASLRCARGAHGLRGGAAARRGAPGLLRRGGHRLQWLEPADARLRVRPPGLGEPLAPEPRGPASRSRLHTAGREPRGLGGGQRALRGCQGRALAAAALTGTVRLQHCCKGS
mmetsp:Transcript_67824/g.161890  ORF Transcript_67824/g.161890 Transcript_67824/m.161890 type:complete len:223 (+) Transcript_67824:393-1061(+)